MSTKLSRRSFLQLGLVGCASLGLFGCSFKKRDVEVASSGGTMRIRNLKPFSLDPAYAESMHEQNIIAQLFCPLVTYDYSKNSIVGLAADRWEISHEQDEFVFHLVKEATFHNGDPVHSQDFKRAFERIANPKALSTPSGLNYLFAQVEGFQELVAGSQTELTGVTCPDDYTLRIKLTAAYPELLYVLSHPALGPVPEEASAGAYATHPVGNGPFMLDGAWDKSDKLALKRFDAYPFDKPALDGVQFVFINKIEQAYQEFTAGNLDITDIPYNKVSDAQQSYGEAQDGYTISANQGCAFGDKLATTFMVYNMADTALKDADLRAALSLCVNRQTLCDEYFAQTAQPATDIVPTTISGYKKGAWAYAQFDLDRATSLVQKVKAAQKDAAELPALTLLCCSEKQDHAIGNALSLQFKKAGLTVKVESVDLATYYTRLKERKYQLALAEWVCDYPLIEDCIYPLFYSKSSQNMCGYANEKTDKAILDAQKATSDQSRASAFAAISQEVGSEAPVAPLFYTKLCKVGGAAVSRASFAPTGICDLKNAKMNA